MCVIQGNPEKVSDTQLLVYRTIDGDRQVTVYSNQVDLPETDETNAGVWEAFGLATPKNGKHAAMILPVPLGAQHFEVIDLSGHANLFKKLNACFPRIRESRSDSLGTSTRSANSFAMLPVQLCGSYEYSLVPSLADFARVDSSVFELDHDVSQVLEKHYGPEFAYLVCKLRASKKYHPVAYTHPMPTDGKLFVPTLHYHQGHSEAAPDWDHEIYLVTPQKLGKAASNTHALEQLGPLTSLMPTVCAEEFRKLEIHGHFPNQDLRVTAAHTVRISPYYRAPHSSLPW